MLSYHLDVSAASRWVTYSASPSMKMFPYQAVECGYFEAGSGYYTVRDEKDNALLIYTLSGEGEMLWKGQRSLLIPGSVVLIHCMEHHEYKTVSTSAPWRFRWLHLDGVGLDGYRSALLDALHVVLLSDSADFGSCFDQLEATDPLEGPLACAELSQLVGGLLLHTLRAHYSREDGLSSRRSEILRAAKYIDAHLSEPLTLSTLAYVAGLSKYHFIRVFAHQMGSTPHQYLRQRRVEEARRLLQTTDDSVSEIVERVGYQDTSAFIAHFRESLGVTPTQYRKETYNWR